MSTKLSFIARIQYGFAVMVFTRLCFPFCIFVPIAMLFGMWNPKEGDGLEGALGTILTSVFVTSVIGIISYSLLLYWILT